MFTSNREKPEAWNLAVHVLLKSVREHIYIFVGMF